MSTKLDIVCLKGFKYDGYHWNLAARLLLAAMATNVKRRTRATLAYLALYVLGETDRYIKIDGDDFADAIWQYHHVFIPDGDNLPTLAIKSYARMTSEFVVGQSELDSLCCIAYKIRDSFAETEPVDFRNNQQEGV